MPRIELSDAAARPANMPPKTEAELEAAAVQWCERMGSKLNAKKSGYTPKHRRGGYARCNR